MSHASGRLFIHQGTDMAVPHLCAIQVIHLLWVIVFVLLVTMTTMLAVLVFSRWHLSRKERLLERRKSRMRPLALELLTEEKGGGFLYRLERQIQGEDRHAFELVLLDYARMVKGPEMVVLTEAFERLGYVEEDIGDLARGSNIRKAEAAFHLGTMGSRRAVPDLLATLTSSDEAVEFACLDALGHIGSHEAIQGIERFMRRRP